jgi:hypothetical protein
MADLCSTQDGKGTVLRVYAGRPVAVHRVATNETKAEQKWGSSSLTSRQH